MSEDFEALFQKVRPIVYKFRRYYHHIQLWDRHDWEQEGMITLFQLVSSCPEVLENEAKLFIYFKTKFSNHLKDTLRKQLSQKRQFHQMAYEEIGEVG
ncbi:sigma-70 family RNA polymerase sigma factor, partial [Streptococcus ferus]